MKKKQNKEFLTVSNEIGWLTKRYVRDVLHAVHRLIDLMPDKQLFFHQTTIPTVSYDDHVYGCTALRIRNGHMYAVLQSAKKSPSLDAPIADCHFQNISTLVHAVSAMTSCPDKEHEKLIAQLLDLGQLAVIPNGTCLEPSSYYKVQSLSHIIRQPRRGTTLVFNLRQGDNTYQEAIDSRILETLVKKGKAKDGKCTYHYCKIDEDAMRDALTGRLEDFDLEGVEIVQEDVDRVKDLVYSGLDLYNAAYRVLDDIYNVLHCDEEQN